MRSLLECVQEMCRRLGKLPVTALDTDGVSLASHLERAIKDASRQVQSPGWFWNTKSGVETSSTLDKIYVNQLEQLVDDAGQTVYAEIFHVDTDGNDRDVNVVRNGNVLYNVSENTETFTGTLSLTYTYERPIYLVPEPFQEWIIALASLSYQRQGRDFNNAKDQMLQADLASARQKAIREEVRTSDINFLDTTETRQFRGRPRMRDRSIY